MTETAGVRAASRVPTAVVVSVGAERGLGAALCRRFAAEGRHVLVAGRTPEKLEQVVRTIPRNWRQRRTGGDGHDAGGRCRPSVRSGDVGERGDCRASKRANPAAARSGPSTKASINRTRLSGPTFVDRLRQKQASGIGKLGSESLGPTWAQTGRKRNGRFGACSGNNRTFFLGDRCRQPSPCVHFSPGSAAH